MLFQKFPYVDDKEAMDGHDSQFRKQEVHRERNGDDHKSARLRVILDQPEPQRSGVHTRPRRIKDPQQENIALHEP